MPLNLAKLARNRASATIDFGADVGALQVEYYPERLTTGMLITLSEIDRLSEMTPEQMLATFTHAGEMLAQLLASWDLTETDEASGAEVAVPLDAAHIAALGVRVQLQLLAGIMASQGSQGAEGKADAPEA